MNSIEKVFKKENDYNNLKQVNKAKKKAKFKRKKIRIIALGLAVLMAGTVFVTSLFKKNKNNAINDDKQFTHDTTKDEVEKLHLAALDKLGVELELPKKEDKNKEYINPTGNVDVKEIVEDTNGTIWANEDAYNNSNEVGKVVVDDKQGSLIVNSDGNVYEKETGYEIKEENGTVVETGNQNDNNTVGDFVWDKDRGEFVHKSEVGKYIYSDSDFYFSDGTLAIAKGDLVSKEDYNKACKELSKTKPAKPIEETKHEETFIPIETEKEEYTIIETTITNEGVVNPDGTYTIYGTTYMDKATFEEFILDEYSSINFGFVNGVVYPQSYIDEMNKELIFVK